MTQLSGFWTTNSGTSATGHQQASYTQAQWSTAAKVLSSCSGFEGVAPTLLLELFPEENGANTVQIGTGGALVDGKWFVNDANVDVTIPSASGGGNTRIDRVVLRCSWAGFKCEITRIAGTDAAVPVAPAITQTSGTTYDIQLCQVLVNTSGAVTVTDERKWAIVDTDESTLQDAAGLLRVKDAGITLAKMAANSVDSDQYVDGSIDTVHLSDNSVDDTKAGNRVPQFYRRQGGSATNWGIQGTTTYTPTSVRMQAGSVDLGAGAGVEVTVTFPTAFSNTPIVMITFMAPSLSYSPYLKSAGLTATEFVVVNGGANPLIIFWFAVGPE